MSERMILFMRNKWYFLIPVLCIFLVSCSAEGTLKKETKNVSEYNHSLKDNLEAISQLENNISSKLKEVSASEKEFQQKKHEGLELLKDQESKYEDIEEDFEDYEKTLEKLDKVNAEKLDEENVDNLNQLHESLTNHVNLLKNYLEDVDHLNNKQKNMFNTLKEDEATFKEASLYIKENNDIIHELNKNLTELITSHNNLNKIVANQDESFKENLEDMNDLTVENINMEDSFPERLAFVPDINIPYPEDGVKGIYVSGYNAGGEQLDELIGFMNESGLNSVVIDVKGDYGDIMFDIDTGNELISNFTFNYYDAEAVLKKFEENNIYPIARIVTFKDTLLAEEKPEWSFKKSDGTLWENGNGESFINPFLKEVWDYNLEIAVAAAKAGFKDIQFDYVRFPEGFETYGNDLVFDSGTYDKNDRVSAILDYVNYAHDHLKQYNVDVSVDLFGYAAIEGEAPGIGQNFGQLAEAADVMSAMIYPSHWSEGYFDVLAPDTEPYKVIDGYMKVEKEVFSTLKNPPASRPWLQDFTASYLGSGNFIPYNKEEVEAQVKALNDHGVNEFLLWDATNEYSRGVNFK